MYADFAFYANNYEGTLNADTFDRLSVRALAEVNRLTLNRAKNATGDDLEAVRYAQCAIIDELAYLSSGVTGDVVSESNDGISRSYASGVARSARQRIDAAALVWLQSTNLCAVAI